jgi:hypothetical protein
MSVSGAQPAEAGGMAELGIARADDRGLRQGANADLVTSSFAEATSRRWRRSRLLHGLS